MVQMVGQETQVPLVPQVILVPQVQRVLRVPLVVMALLALQVPLVPKEIKGKPDKAYLAPLRLPHRLNMTVMMSKMTHLESWHGARFCQKAYSPSLCERYPMP